MRMIQLEPIVVEGVRQGQARALNLQKTADNIKSVVAADLIGRFPDPNTAEAVQRAPGISVERDQGEGRYVLIRGTEPRLTSVTINGEQIPAPEGAVRQVALDVIPADQLASIEVHKALTPDMDADGIGGAVNLTTKGAYDMQTTFKTSLATGYNSLVSGANFQGALTYGKRVGPEGAFGYLFSGSYYRTSRGSDNNEFKWGTEAFGGRDASVLEDFQLRDYLIIRERTGLSGTIDYRYDDRSSLYLRGIFNRFGDQEFQRRLRLRFDKGDYDSQTQVSGARVERKLKNRYEEQDIYSLKAGGRHAFSTLDLDYSASYSYAREKEPGRQDITFEQKKVDLAYDISDPRYPTYSVANGKDLLDPGAFSFKELELEDNLTWERNFMARLDLEAPYTLNAFPGALRLGGKARLKNKVRENNFRLLDGYDGDLTIQDVAGDFESRPMHNGRYTIGKSPDPDLVGRLYQTDKARFEEDVGESRVKTDPGNYESSEDVYAAYAQTRLSLGKWTVLVGARYERTDLVYTGNEVVLDEGGDYLSTQPVQGRNTYGYLFPMTHLRYALDGNTHLRLAWTRSLARPNFFDLTPYRLVNREDEELKRGNVDLKPTTAANLDVLFEHYFSSVGLISGGVFYKRLNDYIYIRVFEEAGGTFDGFEVVQPQNGGKADLFGFELTWQQQFTFLPDMLNGFGIYANYTYTHSEADIIDRSAKPTLPGQTTHIGNLALSYEKYGFSGRAALNVHGKYIHSLGEAAADDIYYDRHVQLDLSASQRIRPKVRLFVELINLTDTPLRFYQGSANRPIQQEFYSWWGHVGLRFDM